MNFNLRKLSTLLIVSISIVIATPSAHSRLQEPVPVYKDHLSIGPGLTFASAPYEGHDGSYSVLPTFSFQWGNLFGYNNHDEPLIGFELFRHKRIMFGLAATSGRTFLDLDNISKDKDFLYWGIDENRDRSYEAGFIFRFFSRVGLVEIKAFHDVISTYSGPRSSISWSRPFPDTGNWSIIPRMFIKHYGVKYNSYYYSVSEAENDAANPFLIAHDLGSEEKMLEYKTITRPQYEPGNSGHVGFDLTVEYSISEKLTATGYLAIEKFSGEIETSPLIEDKELILGNIGLRYNF
jgi:outer membrane scaffolding protein for murein synthesis (MipA/OmpV family)